MGEPDAGAGQWAQAPDCPCSPDLHLLLVQLHASGPRNSRHRLHHPACHLSGRRHAHQLLHTKGMQLVMLGSQNGQRHALHLPGCVHFFDASCPDYAVCASAWRYATIHASSQNVDRTTQATNCLQGLNDSRSITEAWIGKHGARARALLARALPEMALRPTI